MKQRTYEGIIPHLERAMSTSVSAYRRNKITKNYMIMKKCEACEGYRINEQAREIKIEGKHIGELAVLVINELRDFLKNLPT